MMRAQKSPLKTSRMHRRRRLVTIFKIGGLFIVVAGIGWGISWLSYRPFWNIAAVNVNGTVSVSASGVQALALNDIGGAYGWFISKSNQLFYPRKKITTAIQSEFPQIAAVQLAIGNHVLNINVTERQPAYRWCASPGVASAFPDDSSALATDQCYFMDNIGYIFMAVGTSTATSTPAGSQFFRFYGRVGTSSSPVGTAFEDSADFSKLNVLIGILQGRGLPSYALIDRPDGVDELFLNQGGMIVFDDMQDTGQVASDVAALQQSTSIFSHGALLDYVDIRLGNKAFYKLVDTSASSTAAQ